ncbi:hypothetical protein HNY73_014374 [Argiope bruennichi]|uniref:Uncharacterized protein n=1 Tax=Argiope bruennichi TaxID=94029 RepID=A0A8T0ENR3_ARGBR|nr:hypothetical protein HNY73_014374 [Argiope bruennichi]
MGLPREKVDVSITGDKSKMIVPPRLRQPLTVMTRSAKVWTPRHLGQFPGVPISLSGEDADWWEATLRAFPDSHPPPSFQKHQNANIQKTSRPPSSPYPTPPTACISLTVPRSDFAARRVPTTRAGELSSPTLTLHNRLWHTTIPLQPETRLIPTPPNPETLPSPTTWLADLLTGRDSLASDQIPTYTTPLLTPLAPNGLRSLTCPETRLLLPTTAHTLPPLTNHAHVVRAHPFTANKPAGTALHTPFHPAADSST